MGDGEDWEEKNLQITNWTCTEYVQDEEGRWPLEGTYEFKEELEEGYELAEGVDALVVEVSVVGDQAAVTATPSTYLVITQGGSWTIELEGNNSLDGDARPKRGLYIYNWSSATIDGDENATLEVNVSGTLNISGGKIIAKAIGKSAIKTAGNPGGNFYMNGGTVKASGSRKVIFDNEGKFEPAGGSITSISDTNGYGFVASGTSTIISGEGTFTNRGTISGSGTLPDNLKTEPGKIEVSNTNPTTKYTGESIRVTDVTMITKPDNAGSLQYTLVKNTGSENEGNGEINSETGELTVEKIGTFKIDGPMSRFSTN